MLIDNWTNCSLLFTMFVFLTLSVASIKQVMLFAWLFVCLFVCLSVGPAWGRSIPFHPFFSLVHSLPHLLLFYFFLFHFLIRFTYFLLFSIPFLSTRIVLLHFQAIGRRRRSNLGLVCCVHFCVICIA